MLKSNRKWIAVVLAAIALFGSGFALGIHIISKNHFSTYAFKSIVAVKDRYISISGEMAALDFEPGLKLRTVEIKCFKSESGYKQCAWAEYSVMNSSSSGILSLELIDNESFREWNEKQILAVVKETNYERTLNIDIPNESMTDTYRYKNGEIRTARLVGSFDKMGSFKTLRE